MFIPINFLGTKISRELLNTIEYLVVGGGGGTSQYGGGAGGGGFISSSYDTGNRFGNTAVFEIFVGDGGDANSQIFGSGSNGENSYITSSMFTFEEIAIGGGHGGVSYADFGLAGNGGSGGGSGPFTQSASQPSGIVGLGTSGQGFNGGLGAYQKVGSEKYTATGGGGGASQPGTNASLGYLTSFAGDGGDGKKWLDGIYYAGGGGGRTNQATHTGDGGLGGGGFAGDYFNPPVPPPANTGGGGAGQPFTGQRGGSGIVKIRYYGEPRATGGIITQSGSYTYHTFTTASITESFEFPIYLPKLLLSSSLIYDNNIYNVCTASIEGIYYHTSSIEIGTTLFTKTDLTSTVPAGYYRLSGSNDFYSTNNNGLITKIFNCDEIYNVTTGSILNVYVSDTESAYTATGQLSSFDWVTSSMTLEVWSKNTSVIGTYDTAIGLNDQSAGGDRDFIEVRYRNISGTKIFGSNFDGTADTVTQPYGNTITIDDWYHSILTWDSGSGQMLYYQNGSLIGSASVPTITTELNNPYYHVGVNDTGTLEYMYIGEYRIYPFALNVSQSLYNYNGTKARYGY